MCYEKSSRSNQPIITGRRTSPPELGAMEGQTQVTSSETIELLRRGENGDFEALKQLSPFLDTAIHEMLESLGLSNQLRSALSKRVTAKNALVTQRILQQEAELLAKSLSGSNANSLERVLAEHVSLCWMALRTAELALQANEEISFREAAWRQSRVESANRNFLAAARTLAQVRRLQIPALLQVNIADQQMNCSAIHALDS